MATTGLWPVKCRLKDVLDYADNPDKTTAQKYLDRDLYATMTYAGNDKKTDKQIYVDAINCPKQRAYQAMIMRKTNSRLFQTLKKQLFLKRYG